MAPLSWVTPTWETRWPKPVQNRKRLLPNKAKNVCAEAVKTRVNHVIICVSKMLWVSLSGESGDGGREVGKETQDSRYLRHRSYPVRRLSDENRSCKAVMSATTSCREWRRRRGGRREKGEMENILRRKHKPDSGVLSLSPQQEGILLSYLLGK